MEVPRCFNDKLCLDGLGMEIKSNNSSDFRVHKSEPHKKENLGSTTTEFLCCCETKRVRHAKHHEEGNRGWLHPTNTSANDAKGIATARMMASSHLQMGASAMCPGTESRDPAAWSTRPQGNLTEMIEWHFPENLGATLNAKISGRCMRHFLQHWNWKRPHNFQHCHGSDQSRSTRNLTKTTVEPRVAVVHM